MPRRQPAVSGAHSVLEPSPTLSAWPRCLLFQVRLDRTQGHSNVATALDRFQSPIPDGAIHREDMPHAQGCGGLRDIEPIGRADVALVDLSTPDAFDRSPGPRSRGIVPVEGDPRLLRDWSRCPASCHDLYVYTTITRPQDPKGLAISVSPLKSLDANRRVRCFRLDRPDDHAAGTDQISREVAPYIHCPRTWGCSPRQRKDECPSAQADRCTVIYGTTRSDIAVQDTRRSAA